jgi:cob(I)alamin adenosyltransferase
VTDSQATSEERAGLVQVYTGDGKGKTTAALGLAVRAAGHGLRTYIGQFMKGFDYGELEGVKMLAPYVTIEQYGIAGWVKAHEISAEQRQAARAGLDKAREALAGQVYDIVVLDEANVALSFGLLDETDVIDLIEHRPEHVELVITGRNAPESILRRAQLVTEMREVRHPFSDGVKARVGIEF